MNCPHCSSPLSARATDSGVAWSCESCRGVLVRRAALAAHLDPRALEALWARASAGLDSPERRCSSCEAPFHVWTEVAGATRIELDACLRCERLWFDADEVRKLELYWREHRKRQGQRGVGGIGPAAETALDGLVLLQLMGDLAEFMVDLFD